MSEFLTVLNAVLPIFCIAGAGVALRQLNWLTADADASLLRVTINVLMPCLVFDSILGNPALSHPGNVWLPPLVGFGTVALGVPFALLLRGATGLRDERARRTFTFVVSVYNYGYVPMPLVLAAFCAGYLPARRAANVNPGLALRDQYRRHEASGFSRRTCMGSRSVRFQPDYTALRQVASGFSRTTRRRCAT